jgi:hypothetical protein
MITSREAIVHKAIRSFMIAAACITTSVTAADAQALRRGAGPEMHAPRPVIAANPRHPFVGTWVGTMTIVEPRPIMFEFDVVDEKYTSGEVLPNNGFAQHANTQLSGAELLWELKNRGEGVWHYQARRVSADSIVGIVVLRGANLPADLPTRGTFVLIRRPSAQTRR